MAKKYYKPEMSVSTIRDPEFINLEPSDISPLMSKCQIKVFYLNGNRNGSYINKETATEMAKTLRGAPIVGWFKEEADDFRDHGKEIIFDGDGIHFNVKTTPYGFVSPDAEVWFQDFEDTDKFGHKEVRTYLMTTGYLWTSQFKESQKAVEGRPHSMELDNETLEGSWEYNVDEGIEYFIIDNAFISKLCILGNDVEPCFEGSSIVGVEDQENSNFSLDKNKQNENDNNKIFMSTLFQMMHELKTALQGGKEMEGKDFEKKQEEEKKKEQESQKEGQAEETPTPPKKEEKEKKTDNTLAEQYAALAQSYQELQEQCQELLSFKTQTEKREKEELIESFYMLSDKDKEDVLANIDSYSLDEIESKLSVICVRKRVNFEVPRETQDEKRPPITFNLDHKDDSQVPDFVLSLKRTKEQRTDI